MLYRVRFEAVDGEIGHVEINGETLVCSRARARGIAEQLWRVKGWGYRVIQVQDDWGVIHEEFRRGE